MNKNGLRSFGNEGRMVQKTYENVRERLRLTFGNTISNSFLCGRRFKKGRGWDPPERICKEGNDCGQEEIGLQEPQRLVYV